MDINFVFVIAILILSVVAHELAHGYTADFLGDPTARLAGRLTLNPLKHLDLFGSILVPALTFLAGGFIFGWAKPVPYNPYNLKASHWSEAFVAAAGPATNFLLALIFGLIVRFGVTASWGTPALLQILSFVVIINLVLGFFNLVPIPPLDGSKILFAILPFHMSERVRFTLERYGLILVLMFVILFWSALSPFVGLLFELITGLSAF